MKKSFSQNWLWRKQSETFLFFKVKSINRKGKSPRSTIYYFLGLLHIGSILFANRFQTRNECTFFFTVIMLLNRPSKAVARNDVDKKLFLNIFALVFLFYEERDGECLTFRNLQYFFSSTRRRVGLGIVFPFNSIRLILKVEACIQPIVHYFRVFFVSLPHPIIVRYFLSNLRHKMFITICHF